MATDRVYDLEQLAIQPGTYFNPQTEVVVIVDDSSSVDQSVFNLEEYEGADWVRISDEVPVDESALDEAFENFQSAFDPTGETVSSATLDSDDTLDDDPNDTLEPDPDDDEV